MESASRFTCRVGVDAKAAEKQGQVMIPMNTKVRSSSDHGGCLTCRWLGEVRPPHTICRREYPRLAVQGQPKQGCAALRKRAFQSMCLISSEGYWSAYQYRSEVWINAASLKNVFNTGERCEPWV